MKTKYRILIASGPRILREGLRALLHEEPLFEVMSEAQELEEHRPDLVLITSPVDENAIKELRERLPATRIALLEFQPAEISTAEALHAGADRCIPKGAHRQELLNALKGLLVEKTDFGIAVRERRLGNDSKRESMLQTTAPWKSLTQRELETLKLIAQGYKTREVADYLYISSRTVEKHRASLMKKLGLQNAATLTAFAIRKGLVKR
jgi:two-component system response regulator NreC